MELFIYSLQKTMFQGKAKLLQCQTAAGEVTVLSGHEPYIGVIMPGAMRVVDEKGSEHFFQAQSGFLEADRQSRVTCLLG